MCRTRSGIVKSLRALAHDAASDEPLQRAQLALIFWRHKTDRIADGIGATRAPDAMDVILDVHREVVVDDMRDAVHINAARRNICRYKHGDYARLEILQRPQPLVLRTVGVQRRCLDAFAFKMARNAIRAVFHAREHEHHIHLGFA